MWESRVLCEISKPRWKSFCDFHGGDISTAAAGASEDPESRRAKLDRRSASRTRDQIEGKGTGTGGPLDGDDAREQIDGWIPSTDHRVRSFASFVRRGLSRGRYDSPSITKSYALLVKRSMALCARIGSAKVASHSSGPRFEVTTIDPVR